MKIAVVLRKDLEPRQRLNVAAFSSGAVASWADAVGEDYRDGSGTTYLPMFKDPFCPKRGRKLRSLSLGNQPTNQSSIGSR